MGPMVPHFQEDEMFPEFTIADIEFITVSISRIKMFCLLNMDPIG